MAVQFKQGPLVGGQFERLIGLFKKAFYKSIGNGTLKWSELEEVVLDVEVAMNNRPLSYLEEDIQAPVLTPNSMLQINPSYLPELETQQTEGEDLRKRARILKNCKSAMWKRWSREYVRSLREQHRNLCRNGQSYPKIGDVVIVHDKDQPRNRWKLAIVTRLITGKDNITRGAVLKTGKGTIERAVKHLHPLELSCDRQPRQHLNPKAPEFLPRPTRAAAVEAKKRIRQISYEKD